MWNGKNKALTFSFDDGVMQDFEVVRILNKYGLKATFNLNSALLGTKSQVSCRGFVADHNKISPSDVKTLYSGHEVAVHTLVHPALTLLDDDAIIYQVEQDRIALESLVGYDVKCMAYPGGNVDDRVINLLKTRTKIKFSRGVKSTFNFDLQDELLNFCPTTRWEEDCNFDLIEKFINLKTDKPQLFYIWGHSYELDFGKQNKTEHEKITSEKFEKMCKMLAGHDDIFYGTNSEVLF